MVSSLETMPLSMLIVFTKRMLLTSTHPWPQSRNSESFSSDWLDPFSLKKLTSLVNFQAGQGCKVWLWFCAQLQLLLTLD